MSSYETEERYGEEYRLMDWKARFAPRPLHGSPDAGFVDEDDDYDSYEADAWECANNFECGYDRAAL